MIRKVTFKNFYSFCGEQEISFLASKKRTYDYFESISGDQITKVAGFVGGNASGKTNVMRFFSFISYFICNMSEDSSYDKKIAFKSFFNNSKVSSFSVEFENNNNIFYYSFSIKNNIILNEALSLKPLKKFSRKEEVFVRGQKGILKLNSSFFKNISINNLPDIRNNISFVAFIQNAGYKVTIIDSVFTYFLNMRSNINEKGDVNTRAYSYNLLHVYLNDSQLKKKVEEFIRKFDVGLEGFKIKHETKEDKNSISIKVTHLYSGKNNTLDFDYESRGTKSIFFTMASILYALKHNSVVVIDEIETGLHPEAINKLLLYFIDQNKEGKAQLIFSSHYLGFMSRLDMHQIYLTDKNKKGESRVIRLNEVEGVRSDENFYSKYMTGVYGSFPKIRI